MLEDTGDRVTLGVTLAEADTDGVLLEDTGDADVLGVLLWETRDAETLVEAVVDGVLLDDTGDAVTLDVTLDDMREADTLVDEDTVALTVLELEGVADAEGVRLGDSSATAGKTVGEGTPTTACATGKVTPVQFARRAKVALSAEGDEYRLVWRLDAMVDPHVPVESTHARV